MIRLRLTEAQRSAVECRDWSDDPVMAAAWDGGHMLEFRAEFAQDLYREVADASSGESDHADILRKRGEPMWRGTQGAADALTNLSMRILKEAAKVVANPDR